MVVEKFLSTDDFEYAQEYARNSQYEYGESDSGGTPTGMTCDILTEDMCDDDKELCDIVHKNICKKFPEMETEYELYRAYVNCFAPRELANFHQDCDEPEDQITFLYYVNDFYAGIDEGGCTEFYLEDKLIGILPIPNSIVKFTGWIWHRATPLKSNHRFTYAFKYCKKDY